MAEATSMYINVQYFSIYVIGNSCFLMTSKKVLEKDTSSKLNLIWV